MKVTVLIQKLALPFVSQLELLEAAPERYQVVPTAGVCTIVDLEAAVISSWLLSLIPSPGELVRAFLAFHSGVHVIDPEPESAPGIQCLSLSVGSSISLGLSGHKPSGCRVGTFFLA